jgi:hypothetical protein
MDTCTWVRSKHAQPVNCMQPLQTFSLKKPVIRWAGSVLLCTLEVHSCHAPTHIHH